jgi:hypothetical protein
MGHPVAGSQPRDAEEAGGRFYASLAIGIAIVVIVGFAPTYWRPIVFGPASLSPFVHLHAALFFGWAVLFALQARLAASGRIALHRRIGRFAAAWSLVAVVVGLRLALFTVARDVGRVDGTAGAVMTVIPLSQVCMFALFVGLGLARRRQRAAHERCMTLAALVSVTPAFGRIGNGLLGADAAALPLAVFVASTGLLVGVVGYDTRRHGRLHPVFLWGGAAVILIRIARIPFAMSDAWRAIAEAIARWVGGQ